MVKRMRPPGWLPMRGRSPKSLTIARGDLPILLQLAHSQSSPWYLVRRARTVLAIAAGQRTHVVAAQMQCDVDTVRRTSRCYASAVLAALLARPQRPGRPSRLSPPGVDPNHSTPFLGPGRWRFAYHALVDGGRGRASHR